MREVVNNPSTFQPHYREAVKRLFYVEMPPEGRIKEVIIRHPLSYDYATSYFKEIEVTPKILKLI